MRPYVRNGGSAASWSGDRNGIGCNVMMLSAHLGKGVLDRVVIIGPDIARCQYGLSNQHSQGSMQVRGGRVVESGKAWAKTTQLGSLNVERTNIVVSNATRVQGLVFRRRLPRIGVALLM